MSELSAVPAEQDVLARLLKAEADLDELRKELDHSCQLATLGTLTAGIAHEINNILTPVLAYAHLARSNPDDTALRDKALERTIAGVESASRITEAVLGFARTDDEAEHAVIAETIDSSLACLSRDPRRDGLRVVIDVDQAATVRIRPLALQQVLLNLILNSVSALGGKPGELRIHAEERPDGTTLIRVRDTGPGIPGEIESTLFEPFVTTRKAGKQSSPAHGGSGLGLAVCRRLIENHGGSIMLEQPTETGQGASFAISLKTIASAPVPKKTA